MSTRKQILGLLTDGHFHSGTEMGDRLGVSRAAINKSIKNLVDRGLEIHSVSGKGYRWTTPTPLLDAQEIRKNLAPMVLSQLGQLDVLDEVESTSDYLVGSIGQGAGDVKICLAEAQTGGRGRRGRNWLATPYQNLALSIAWRYEFGSSQLSGLSIAAGIAVARALQFEGIEGVQLKWPNDILHQDRKLAGLLVDLRGEVDGPTHIILGLGLNFRLDDAIGAQVGQPWTDLASITDYLPDRNRLAARIIDQLAGTLSDFPETGLRPYIKEWQQRHAFENRLVRLMQADREILGTVCGLDESGALKLDTGGQFITVHSGEVSLRAG